MFGTLAWRRLRFGRFTYQQPWPAFGLQTLENGGKAGPGPRPVLWDLWSDLNVQGAGGNVSQQMQGEKQIQDEDEVGWESIMPIAALVRPIHAQSPSQVSLSPSPPIPLQQGRFQRWTRRGRTQPPSQAPPAPTHANTSADMERDADANSTTRTSLGKRELLQHDINTAAHLQVVVAIAMPARRAPGGGSYAGDTPEYTLGVYECDWRRGNENG